MRILAERKNENKHRRKKKERNAWKTLGKNPTEGQLAAYYATVNRQLSSIQAENPVALQQHILSMLIVFISTETRFHFFFPKLHL